MVGLPYVTAPGNISKALNAILKAATPPKISQDFVKSVLKIPGGSGNQFTTFLKKIGFANADGSPSVLYSQFRNPATSKQAVAKAIRHGYGSLYKRNEYVHTLNDNDLQGIIVEETGLASDSHPVQYSTACLRQLISFADFSEDSKSVEMAATNEPYRERYSEPEPKAGIGLNLGYTINLNLPATSDITVFNAIFKSLKEHLLRDSDA